MAVHTAEHHSAGQVLPFRESLMAMLGICFVTMLVALDQTVVGTALPTIWRTISAAPSAILEECETMTIPTLPELELLMRLPRIPAQQLLP